MNDTITFEAEVDALAIEEEVIWEDFSDDELEERVSKGGGNGGYC